MLRHVPAILRNETDFYPLRRFKTFSQNPEHSRSIEELLDPRPLEGFVQYKAVKERAIIGWTFVRLPPLVNQIDISRALYIHRPISG